jgi:hypothetical protein
VIYTTNAIESLNYQLRKVTRNRSILASDEAMYKIMYLALRNAAKKWTMPIPNWGAALNQFSFFLASGFRSYEFYLHKTIDRLSPFMGLAAIILYFLLNGNTLRPPGYWKGAPAYLRTSEPPRPFQQSPGAVLP